MAKKRVKKKRYHAKRKVHHSKHHTKHRIKHRKVKRKVRTKVVRVPTKILRTRAAPITINVPSAPPRHRRKKRVHHRKKVRKKAVHHRTPPITINMTPMPVRHKRRKRVHRRKKKIVRRHHHQRPPIIIVPTETRPKRRKTKHKRKRSPVRRKKVVYYRKLTSRRKRKIKRRRVVHHRRHSRRHVVHHRRHPRQRRIIVPPQPIMPVAPAPVVEPPKSEITNLLVENFVSLQKVMTTLAVKVDEVSERMSKLLELFEVSAKALAEKDFDIDRENREILEKMDSVLDQNKILARGIALMHERIPREPPPMAYPPQPSYSSSYVREVSQAPPQPININVTQPAAPLKMTKEIPAYAEDEEKEEPEQQEFDVPPI